MRLTYSVSPFSIAKKISVLQAFLEIDIFNYNYDCKTIIFI